MRVLRLTKYKKNLEVYAFLRIGDGWELELKNSTYIVSAGTLFESLNIRPSVVMSIQNWFRSYNESLIDEVLNRWTPTTLSMSALRPSPTILLSNALFCRRGTITGFWGLFTMDHIVLVVTSRPFTA